MPTTDECHEHLVHALDKAGWKVESAPFKLYHYSRIIYTDLRVSQVTNGVQEELLLIELKCVPERTSSAVELYTAIGQYLVYRAMLVEFALPFSLYLVVPEVLFRTLFDNIVRRVVKDNSIKLIVVNLEKERITTWVEDWT
jgi:hypothetical protein